MSPRFHLVIQIITKQRKKINKINIYMMYYSTNTQFQFNILKLQKNNNCKQFLLSKKCIDGP